MQCALPNQDSPVPHSAQAAAILRSGIRRYPKSRWGHFKDNLPRAIQRLTNPLQAATIRELDPPDVGLWRSLGARFHGMEEVVGSIPTRSTKYTNNLAETFQTVCPHFARKWQNLAARRHLLFSILSFLLALPFHRVTSSGCSSFAICPSFRHGWRLRF